jgi:AraC-like DNA-binding protein
MRTRATREAASVRRGLCPCDAVTFARLCRARDYLGASYRERITLENAARHACLSPFHFNRLFARAFSETPHEFLTRRRMEEARRRLLAENESVTDICFDIGYQSLGSFSSRFRSLTGLSPAAFRRQARISFAGLAGHAGRLAFEWPLYYIPACFQQNFLGPGSVLPPNLAAGESQESRSIPPRLCIP